MLAVVMVLLILALLSVGVRLGVAFLAAYAILFFLVYTLQ
jgi:hypothetical protein